MTCQVTMLRIHLIHHAVSWAQAGHSVEAHSQLELCVSNYPSFDLISNSTACGLSCTSLAILAICCCQAGASQQRLECLLECRSTLGPFQHYGALAV